MKKYGALYNIPLFRGVCETELEQMLSCLDGKYRRYQKQALLLAEGEAVSRFGIVLEGSLQVASEDIFGNRNIVEQLDPGELYGAAFACAEVLLSPVSIIAVKDSLVLDLDIEKVLTLCPDSCPFHRQLIQNMVHILAKKNVALSEKIRHTSKRTTREICRQSPKRRGSAGSGFLSTVRRWQIISVLSGALCLQNWGSFGEKGSLILGRTSS